MATTKKTTAKRMEARLRAMLERKRPVRRVSTFEEAGVLTRNRGLVVALTDGTKFQIEIIEDRRGW
jgi:hypothetical protein